MNDFAERIPFALHESELIADCLCNGCLRLEVLTKRRGRDETEHYYCKKAKHGYFDPRKVKECKNALYDSSGICKRGKWAIRLDG